MKKRINNNGFTLIEILAVITIIGLLSGIALSAVFRLVDRAKIDQRKQQEKAISMAAESYLQANRTQRPKYKGQVTTISLRDLKDSNYLKEDIKSAGGVSCMNDSYVEVKKVSDMEYTYKSFLICEDGTRTAPTPVPTP